jgi:hypothetical protein
MRNHKVLFAGVIVAVLAVIGVANIAGAGAGAQQVRRWARTGPATTANAVEPRAATLILIEEEGQATYIDVGPRGETVGDYVVFRDRLRDPNSDALIGALSVQCTFQFANSAECHGTAILFNRGKLTFAGNVPPASLFALAITGGTGEFRAARGEVFVHDSSGPRDRIGVHLV